MKILVLGAGAVGGYLGSRLEQANHSVTLVARGASADAIQRNGLSLVDGDHQYNCRPALATSIRQAFEEDEDGFDAILLCVKAYDAQAALDELLAFNPTPPKVITLQNGIGIEEIFVKELGPERVVAGSLTTPLSHETFHSIVVERGDRGLALAATAEGENVSDLAAMFNGAGVSTIVVDDFRSMKWSKALLNMVGNATSAILNRHPRVIYKYGPTFKLEMEMLKETVAVMRAMDLKAVNLPGAKAASLARAVSRLPGFLVKPGLSGRVARGRGNKMPSFHIDLMTGRQQSEVLFHNGAVAHNGHELGLQTPVNAALNDILMKLVRREIPYDEYDGQPNRLVDEVEAYRNTDEA